MSTDDDGAPPATLCLSPYFRRFVVLTKGSTLPFISTSRYGVLLLSDVSGTRGVPGSEGSGVAAPYNWPWAAFWDGGNRRPKAVIGTKMVPSKELQEHDPALGQV